MFQSDIFKTKSGKNIKITFIKHASIIIDYDGFIIYIDPVNSYTDLDKFVKSDMILITHEHYDHFDREAIKKIKKENTKIILNKNSHDILGDGIVLKNYDTININNIIIEAVPAYNTTKNFHPKGRDNGYILQLDNIRIYIAGDIEDMPEIAEFKNIDISFLPVNQPYTMTIEQALNVAKILKPKILYPYHYDKTDVKQMIEILSKFNIEVRVKNM
jgi:L-ascorbate metabolism protein UlaG (beta-lactamase superfamily)